MERPIIDVVVTIFNAEDCITEFFEMFAAQKDPRLRLIIVDDGSDDGSYELAKKLSENSGLSTILLHQENAGVSAARNLGIKHSDAEYIAFFDIDDICSENYVKELLIQCQNEKFDVLVFKRFLLYEGKKEMPPSGKPGLIRLEREEILKEILFDTDRFGNIHNILVNRFFICKENIRMNPSYKYYEDFDYAYRVFAAAKRILFLDRWLYGYVVKQKGSIMATYSIEKVRSMQVIRNLEQVMAKEVPAFAPLFEKYALPRLYWSLLWQTALVAPSYRSFKMFANTTGAKKYMKRLKGFPEKKVIVLRSLFLLSDKAYYLTVKKLGGNYTALGAVKEDAIKEAAIDCPKP